MHEWGLTRALVGELGRIASAHGAAKIVAAKLRVCALAGISPEHLREQFAIAAAGSVAAGARLDIEIAPGLPDRRAAGVGVYVESVEIGE